MKLTLFLLTLFAFQLHAQSELFQQNNTPYADFDYSDDELSAFKSEGSLTIFNRENHNSNLANKLFELKEGKSMTVDKATKKSLKVLKKVEVEHFRINYMFFDGEALEYEKIEQLRDMILDMTKFHSFEKLAQRYSMDMNKNRGGDSGWFKKRSVPEDFKNAALSSMRAANETFKIDLEQNDWYYLILKSYSPKLIEEILVLETQD